MDRREHESRRKYDHRVRRDDRDVYRVRNRFSDSVPVTTYDEQSRDEDNYNSLAYNEEYDRHSLSSLRESSSDHNSHKTMDYTGLHSFNPHSSDSSEIPLNPDMPLMAYQLQLMELMKSMCPAIIRPSCSLYPPKNPVPATQRVKPIGCKTIYVSGLPDVADNDMVAEIFFPCGAIDSINTRKSATKIFSHVRFVNRGSVDQAILFNGFEIIAEKGDREKHTLNVQYALEKNIKRDQDEYEREEREHYRLLDEQKKIQEETEDPPAKRRLTEYEAACVLDTLKNNTNFLESISQVKLWIEKGDINRKNANYVYNLINSLNSHVKRLVKEKKDHEQFIELQKFEQVTRAKEIKDQVLAIDEVFEKACLKKVWDNFTKPQRRNISQWKEHAKAVFKELGVAREVSIEDRVEVGMELDEEDTSDVNSLGHASYTQESFSSHEEYSSGGMRDASAQHYDIPTTQGGQVDTGVGSSEVGAGVDYFQQLKNPELDSENSKTIQDLKYENEKLQAQVLCLKALVEQNTNLAMQLQTYKKDAELAKQEFNTAVQSREDKISNLNTALYGLKLYLYHSGYPQTVLEDAPQDWGVTVDVVEGEQSVEAAAPEGDSCTNETDTGEHPETVQNEPAIAEGSSKSSSERPCQLHLSGVEMAQVGIICSYLAVCPRGAELEDIVKHLETLSCKVTAVELQRLLQSLPTLFLCSPHDESQEPQPCKWSFAGFESVKYLTTNT